MMKQQPMRRRDREITDRKLIDDIIRRAQVLRVALAVKDEPYILPLSFGYDGAAFYFHTATAGRKIEMIAANPRVCFELEGEVRLLTGALGCEWSVAYESVIGYGAIEELFEPATRDQAMQQIMLHYSGRGDWTFDEREMYRTRLWKLTIETMTAKKS